LYLLLTKYCFDAKRKRMSEGCSTYERDEKSVRIVIRKPGGKRPLAGAWDGRIALQ
jgi:hypothetical protein